MSLKRIVSAIAIAALVGASTLGIGAGVTDAHGPRPNVDTSQIQSVDWHGGTRGTGGATDD
ncbi:MAG TPA: hypothetical protein VHU62_16560 [Mycobacterium sp.]|jgi:hypothetical protein|nr:hypothetical protein [Mycobacterium sp.]